jgi:hypothetical protein
MEKRRKKRRRKKDNYSTHTQRIHGQKERSISGKRKEKTEKPSRRRRRN